MAEVEARSIAAQVDRLATDRVIYGEYPMAVRLEAIKCTTPWLLCVLLCGNRAVVTPSPVQRH
jgi:hypothetical protein